MNKKLEMTKRRRSRQSGQQIIEFAFVAFMFMPLFMGAVVTGMNLIRSNQVNHIARDMADMYIHGADFSDRAMQRVAKRLATGLDLQVGSATGNVADNTGNSGRGIIWVSKLMKVGTQLEASCQAALPAACTNLGKFVFLEHIRFGNGALESERDASVGHPGATRDIFGRITQDVVKTGSAAVPEPQQTVINNMWQGNSPASRTPLADQQIVYMVEVYFKSPDLSLGELSGRGVYARWFY
jgi:hypothetical protein